MGEELPGIARGGAQRPRKQSGGEAHALGGLCRHHAGDGPPGAVRRDTSRRPHAHSGRAVSKGRCERAVLQCRRPDHAGREQRLGAG